MKIRAGMLLIGLVGVLSACDATATNPPTTSMVADPGLQARFLALMKTSELSIATDATEAPDEFLDSDGRTFVGMDIDIASAIAQVLGVDTRITQVFGPRIIPAVQAGTYDIGMSSLQATPQITAVVPMVTYFVAGESFFVAQGRPQIDSLAGLCGHRVAVESATAAVDDATMQAQRCLASGRAVTTVDVYPDQNTADWGVVHGDDDVGIAPTPVAEYQVQTFDGSLRLSGSPYDLAPYGIAVSGISGLAALIEAALREVIGSGRYMRILAKWGLQAGALTAPAIEGAST